MDIQEKENEYFFTFIHGYTNLMLKSILNPEIPYVWIIEHAPCETTKWIETNLPLSLSDNTFAVKARHISYDLLFETKDFFHLINDFEPYGIHLIQLEKPVPNTLVYEQIPPSKRTSILKSNGFYLEVKSPHKGETTQINCIDKNHLQSLKL